jgi:hypothetical protein
MASAKSGISNTFLKKKFFKVRKLDEIKNNYLV